MTIGERIKQARKEKGLTQKRLGELSGTSEITVRQYEIGKRQPRLVQLQRIALALETTVSELVEPGYWTSLSKDEMDESWESNVPFFVSPEDRVSNFMSLMNKEGKRKVADYAEDIFPRYRAETTPQPTSAPPEGTTDTPAPEPPPETAENGG